MRTGLGGFFAGAYSVLWGVKRIARDRELRKLTVLPFMITLVIYVALAVLMVIFADDVWAKFVPRPQEGWWIIPQSVAVYLWWGAMILSVFASVGLLILAFAVIVELVGGPFYDKMAIRILEEHHIEAQEPGLIEGSIPDLIRSLLYLFAGVGCWAIGLIPVIGLPFVAMGAVIVWLGFGTSAINPALLATGNGLGARIRYSFRFFLSMLGIGGVVAVSMLVPLLGLLAIPASIVGATELYAQSRG